jgi:hypothetical protein
MKFHIVRLRQVDVYAVEYYSALAYFLRDAGHKVITTTWETLPDTAEVILYIHSGFYGIPADVNVRGKHIVLMNLEQMTRKNYLDLTKSMLIKYPQMMYADYSTANLDIMEKELGWRGMWLPYFHHPQMATPSTEPRSTDLLFYGCMSHERSVFCKQYGAHVIAAFMNERDSAIRKARCVLNCHYGNDYGVFESLRAYHAVYHGTPVFTPDESLEETCFLSAANRAYLLRTLPVPDDLPPLDFAEEHEKARMLVDIFIRSFHPSSPTRMDPLSSDNR